MEPLTETNQLITSILEQTKVEILSWFVYICRIFIEINKI